MHGKGTIIFVLVPQHEQWDDFVLVCQHEQWEGDLRRYVFVLSMLLAQPFDPLVLADHLLSLFSANSSRPNCHFWVVSPCWRAWPSEGCQMPTLHWQSPTSGTCILIKYDCTQQPPLFMPPSGKENLVYVPSPCPVYRYWYWYCIVCWYQYTVLHLTYILPTLHW